MQAVLHIIQLARVECNKKTEHSDCTSVESCERQTTRAGAGLNWAGKLRIVSPCPSMKVSFLFCQVLFEPINSGSEPPGCQRLRYVCTRSSRSNSSRRVNAAGERSGQGLARHYRRQNVGIGPLTMGGKPSPGISPNRPQNTDGSGQICAQIIRIFAGFRPQAGLIYGLSRRPTPAAHTHYYIIIT